MSNHKYGRIFQGSSTLALRPRLHRYERIFTKNDFVRSLMPQHLQQAPSRTFGPTSLSLVPARTTHASTLSHQGRTSTPSSLRNSSQHEPASSPPQIQRCKLGDLYTLITKSTLIINDP